MSCDQLEPWLGNVIQGLEPFEVVFATNQPEYNPLRALKSMKDNGAILTRWSPTEEQRWALANGADIFLEVLTFHHPLQPVALYVMEDSPQVRRRFVSRYGLQFDEECIDHEWFVQRVRGDSEESIVCQRCGITWDGG